jgi:mono/diheme cytochrome c family protein
MANNKKRRTIMRSKLKNKRRVVLAGALALVAVGLSVVLAHAEPEKKADQKGGPKKPTGAELYAINCNRCHPERYATEFTSAQWKTIMLHMRVRANLPAAQAKVILKYLQEDSGN